MLASMKKIMGVLLMLVIASNVDAAERFVCFNDEGWLLNKDNKVVVCLDHIDDKGIIRAARDLCTDIEKVCGAETVLIDNDDTSSIIIKVNPKMNAIEKYVIQIDDQHKMTIIGSDKRGAIYGIYEVTRQIGVSPWYYWADVPIEKHTQIRLIPGSYTDGEPAVRYRGIFLNDEAPCLTTWVKNTFNTNYGGHEFYEKVFELILRLKGNFLWPAMWSWAFYADDPLNSSLANEMGVVIGTSHHEPMARNHQEWARHRGEYGAWNYKTNKTMLDKFFREGMERVKDTEDVITIGMRGDGDEAMSAEADTNLLLDIVKNQRKIIRDVTRKSASKTPQVWALYKEVLDYYDQGMRVPDDVIMLLCDDNWGNVRRVPNVQEQKHKGGWGLYYHVDYVGAPRNSKWLNVTPIQNMWEQLTLAYEYGINKMWILNVGDLKPMEYPIQLFMDMAWKGGEKLPDHTLEFCKSQFGESQAADAQRLLNLCCKYNGRVTAEMLDQYTYNLESGEWKSVVDDYNTLEMEALRQFITLKPEYKDAYQQLILFPIQAMGNIYRMYYAQAMNTKLYAEGNPDANVWADKVEEAFRRDSILCAAYNHDLADGKWNGMMIQKHIGYRSWNDDFAPNDVMPRVKRMEAKEYKSVFSEKNGVVAIEAEHWYEITDAQNAQWNIIPFMGRTLSGVSLMPYTASTDGASLSYRFNTSSEAKKVMVVVKSTLDYLNKGGLRYNIYVDGEFVQTVNFNENLNEKPENIYSLYYPTVARRIVEKTIEVGIPAGNHTIKIVPLEPGIVFEKIVIDCGGYTPSYLHWQESPRTVE